MWCQNGLWLARWQNVIAAMRTRVTIHVPVVLRKMSVFTRTWWDGTRLAKILGTSRMKIMGQTVWPPVVYPHGSKPTLGWPLSHS